MLGQLLIILAFKPLLICAITSLLLAGFKKESADFQFNVIWVAFLFIPITLLFSLVNVWVVEFELPYLSIVNWSNYAVSANDFVYLCSALCLVSSFLLSYRWLGLFALHAQESVLDANAQKLNVEHILNEYQLQQVTLLKSHGNHIAYVWRIPLWGTHRLVLGDQFFALTLYQQECVLRHECAHIKRNDWLKSECVYVICAVFWWLPLIWALRKRSDQLAEQACDDWFVDGQVSSGQSSKKIYSKLLLSLHSGEFQVGNSKRSENLTAVTKRVINPESGSDFFHRILRVLERYVDRDPVSPASTAIIALVVLLMLSPVFLINFTVSEKTSAKQIFHEHLIEIYSFDSTKNKKDWLDKSELLYSMVPNPLKVTDTFGISDGVNVEIEELLTIAEFEPAAFNNDLFLPTGNIQVVGFLPNRLVLPEFPQVARYERISGEVRANFSVDKNGYADNIEFINSAPMGVFESSVLSALNQYWFDRPTNEIHSLIFYFRI